VDDQNGYVGEIYPITNNSVSEGELEKERDEINMNTRENVLFPDDEWEERRAQRRMNNIEHIIWGDYTPADRDVDLLTIERFIFYTEADDFDDIFLIDKLQGYVYHHPLFVTSLQNMKYSSVFRDEDLERLIVMIEASGMRDWDAIYQGEIVAPEDSPFVDGGSWGWGVGILFSDGTMLRRGGGGVGGVMRPPEEQFRILTDFVEKMSEEIIERHNAEQAD